MAFTSGFFDSSVGAPRVYSSSHFTNYLKGLVVDGFLPNDTGLKVYNFSGANPPSVSVYPGSVYYQGLYLYNDSVYTMALNTAATIGDYHLIFVCFDSTAKTITLESIYNNNPAIDTSHITEVTFAGYRAGQTYIPVARVTDNGTSQPTAPQITDLRGTYLGGVRNAIAPLGIDTPLLADDCVTADKLDTDAVLNANVKDNELTFTKMNDEGHTGLSGYTYSEVDQAADQPRYGATTGNYVSKNNEILIINWRASVRMVTGGKRLRAGIEYSTDNGSTWTDIPQSAQLVPMPYTEPGWTFAISASTAFKLSNKAATCKFRVMVEGVGAALETTTLEIYSVYAIM